MKCEGLLNLLRLTAKLLLALASTVILGSVSRGITIFYALMALGASRLSLLKIEFLLNNI
jgi:hypothetical protein